MRNGPIIVTPHPPPSLQYKQSPQSSPTARSFQPRPAIPDNHTSSGFRALEQIMYSLSTHEKLKEERGVSEREILWRHLRDRKKSGRMVRRIYNKTREEMAHSCGERSQRWIEDAAANMESWSRAPEMSVHQHTFRDRRKEVEIGPANGHISARKYIPRLVLSGGGKIDSGKTADLMERLSVLSPLRGNDPNALHNPCRPTVIINDTAKILGRLEHPRWRAPKYVLRVREREKEIGPDVKYADRSDMEKILSGMVKNSVFAWGPYKGGGPWDSPTCRQEDPQKWVGDQKFYPGFRFRDNRGETLAGEKFPFDITNDGEYKRPADFSRDCCSEEKLPRHRFCLVVRNNEYTRPSGKIRRSLCFKESPPGPYPEEKTYFTSLKAVSANSVSTANPREANLVRGPLCASSSLSSLPKRRDRMSDNKDIVCRGDMSCKVGGKQVGGGQVLCLLPRSKSSTVVRISPESRQAKGDKDTGRKDEDLRGIACRQTFPMERSAGRAAEVSGGMRRVSEVATWASSGAPAKSARDYLW